MEFETVIGLEVHVQLLTNSKIFCGSPAHFEEQPNRHIDPLTLALPGALPVPNRKVIEYAIMLGLATKCDIRANNRFARKHYFYPDLPKGYQISQFSEPICERGQLVIHQKESHRSIGIKRIHMEEDAGKSIHDPAQHSSFIDLNRAGVPLLEVVSEPDLRSPEEAGAYLRTLRQLVRYLGISDGNMEEGSLRCDANISLRHPGELKFGTRTEIKNINSFKFVEKALEYEVARQMAILKGGGSIIQETLLFDSVAGVTRSMRSKEDSPDYRYFPDPDIPPIVIAPSWIEELRKKLPELPEAKRQQLIEGYGLSLYDADVITAEKAFVEFFEEVFSICSNAKAACNWIASELFGQLNRAQIPFANSPVSAASLGALIKLIDGEIISGKMAKTVFEEMFNTGAAPELIVEKRGLRQVTDATELSAVVNRVLEANPKQVADYLAGSDKVHGFFVGQVMKATGASANPKLVNDLIRSEIEKRRS